MQILRDITIRKMVLLILVVFSIIWGMATLLTFYNFSTLEQLLTQNSSQKNAYGRCEQVPDMRSCLSSGAMEQGSS